MYKKIILHMKRINHYKKIEAEENDIEENKIEENNNEENKIEIPENNMLRDFLCSCGIGISFFHL